MLNDSALVAWVNLIDSIQLSLLHMLTVIIKSSIIESSLLTHTLAIFT